MRGGGTAGQASTSVCEVEAFTIQQESPVVKRHAVVKSLLSPSQDEPDAPAMRPDPTRAAPLSFVATPTKKKALASSAARSDVEHTMIESFDMSMLCGSPAPAASVLREEEEVEEVEAFTLQQKESPVVKGHGTVKSLISLHSIDSVSSAVEAAAVLECLDIEDFDDDYLSPATSKPAAAAALEKENSNHVLNTKSGGGGGAPDFRAQVVAFYTTHNPAKLGHVDEILATYAGRESSLMSTLEATYTASSSSASGRSPLAPVQTAQATETSQQPQAAHACNTRAKSWQGTHQDPAVKGRKKSLMTRIWRKTKKTVGR